jgi:hypothetical protein
MSFAAALRINTPMATAAGQRRARHQMWTCSWWMKITRTDAPTVPPSAGVTSTSITTDIPCSGETQMVEALSRPFAAPPPLICLLSPALSSFASKPEINCLAITLAG